jgi:hypothetical protein
MGMDRGCWIWWRVDIGKKDTKELLDSCIDVWGTCLGVFFFHFWILSFSLSFSGIFVFFSALGYMHTFFL